MSYCPSVVNVPPASGVRMRPAPRSWLPAKMLFLARATMPQLLGTAGAAGKTAGRGAGVVGDGRVVDLQRCPMRLEMPPRSSAAVAGEVVLVMSIVAQLTMAPP